MCRNCNWEEYLDKIELLLDDEEYEFASNTLQGIKDWITGEGAREPRNHITPKQQQAIENIENSTNY